MADLSQTAANVKLMSASSRVATGQAGEGITQGQPIYQLTSDGKWYRCDANDGQAKAECRAIALTPASTNGFIAFALPGADIDVGATLVIGQTYIVSVNVGAIAPISDLATSSWVTPLGVAVAATTLRFNPQPSGIQRAA
jgi:predicted transcriptional regulator